MPRVRRTAGSILIAVFTCTAEGLAQAPPHNLSPPESQTVSRRVSMTVSGGVSLGSYQAGATWAFIYILKNHDELALARQSVFGGPPSELAEPRRYALDVLTGASAGNINSLLAGIEYCADTAFVQPEASLFWKAWTTVGYPELAKWDISRDELSPFSRRAFGPIWQSLATQLSNGPSLPSCDLLIGITTTKLNPDTLFVASGIEVPVQRFAGVVRLISNTTGLAFAQPRPDDVLHDDLTDILILDPAMQEGTRVPRRLTRSRDVAIDIGAIRELAEASAAFPVAFAPRLVSYQLLDSLQWEGKRESPPPCRRKLSELEVCAPARVEQFVDGGIFDNRPLGLALGLSRAREDVVGRARDAAETAVRVRANDAIRKECAGRDPIGARDTPIPETVARLSTEASQIAGFIVRDSTLWGANLDPAQADSLARLRGMFSATNSRLQEALDDLSVFIRTAQLKTAADSVCIKASAYLIAVQDSLEKAARFKLPRLLYFIDEEARRTDAFYAPPAMVADEERAGVAAAMRVVSNAFQTGQNSELRLFAKRMDQPLGVNSRFPRLMAEHIGHFGAFLAPTFREYDFYAGVYDGLRSAVRELYCRPDDAPPGPAPPTNCEKLWVDVILAQELIQLKPAGRLVLEKLLALEEKRQQPEMSTKADAKTLALATLLEANVIARGPFAPGCRKKGIIIEIPLCSQDLLTVIDVWDDRLEATGPLGRDVLCKGTDRDMEACALVRDAQAVYHAIAMDVLKRIRRAESLLDREGQPGYPGAIGIPLFLERAYNEQFRSCRRREAREVAKLACVDVNPSTSDILGGWWYNGASRAIPVTVAGMRNGTSHWLEWRPTAYLVRWKGFSVSATAPIELIRRDDGGSAAIGGGLTIMPPGAPLSSISLSRIGERGEQPSTDLTLAWFSGVVRIGLRDGPTSVDPFVAGSNVTLGVGDTSGITARLLGLAGRGLVKLSKAIFS